MDTRMAGASSGNCAPWGHGTMASPKLIIRKALVDVGGKMRPIIQVKAVVDDDQAAKLNELFGAEVLFKRAVYAQGFPAGTPVPSPGMAPALGAFLKNDACPEITVKTLLAGQKLQTNSLWDIVAFEYIAKRAFDSLCEFATTASELGTEKIYNGDGTADIFSFRADTLAEVAAVAAAAA